MIQEGLVTLEEVRGEDNSLENLYIRVSLPNRTFRPESLTNTFQLA